MSDTPLLSTTPDDSPLVVYRSGDVLVLRLNRPDARNAMSPELVELLGTALSDAADDPDVRTIVLTGTGDRAFCAGMDLRSFLAASSESRPGLDAARLDVRRLTDGLFPKPVIGAANASAVAGGFELLLGCDMVISSEDADFGLPEVKRGLFAARGGMLLASRLPVAIALELALTGDLIDADRAYGLGLINRVVPFDEVLPTAIEFARRIGQNGPLAVRASKELVRLGMHDPAAALRRQAEWHPVVFGSSDAREGALAFVERRDPVWIDG
ncbi:MAG: enoyl-CoA hydratase [Acidimicrobiaceae bacterium]|nr:enoyl-CoA hydratase [Acidimicrobiaceae bacterium]